MGSTPVFIFEPVSMVVNTSLSSIVVYILIGIFSWLSSNIIKVSHFPLFAFFVCVCMPASCMLVRLPTCLYVCCLPLHLSACPHDDLPACLPAYLTVYTSLCLPACVNPCQILCFPACLYSTTNTVNSATSKIVKFCPELVFT